MRSLPRSALPYTVFGLLLASCTSPADPVALDPTIEAIVASVSEERMAANMRKLESFGTRHVMSGALGSERGIEAAKNWLVQELSSYDARLQVSVQPFGLAAGTARGQVLRDVEVANVVAVLPGTADPARQILVTAHYDSVNYRLKPPSVEERVKTLMAFGTDEAEVRRLIELLPQDADRGQPDVELTAAEEWAPGVSDDASGVAAVLELARVMSPYRFEKTLVFVAFAAEETALEGSRFYAARAEEDGAAIEAVLNNDIIGTEVAGNGRAGGATVRVFAEGPDDSPSRALARYSKRVGEAYVPSMHVRIVFRRDRFLRGGDHLSFLARGIAAVRWTSAVENYEAQHNAADTFENASPAYATRVARMNAAVAASLASAPSAPAVNYTYLSGSRKGSQAPRLSRGESRYAASMTWGAPEAPDVAGYTVMVRDTTAPDWERAIPVGLVTSYTIEDLSIDDFVIGVKATDRDGNESVVAAYAEPPLFRAPAPAAAVSAAETSSSD